MTVIQSYLIECDPGHLHKLNSFSYVYLLFMVVDMDECMEPNICGPHTMCTNHPATYKCSCLQGFESKNKKKLHCTGTETLIVLNKTSIELPMVVSP